MPPIHHIAISPRASSSGRTFSIIFAIIAFVVVTFCLIWGLCIPKYRKKHPRRPSQTRFNTAAQSETSLLSTNTTNQQFSSNPSAPRDLSWQSGTKVRYYDPRTQTPFPNDLTIQRSYDFPMVASTSNGNKDGFNACNSQGLFSPNKHRSPPEAGDSSVELQESATKTNHSQAVHSPDSPTGYALTLPEPMLLRAKSAGKAPRLTKQLEKFPLPRSSSSFGDLAHPRKLFNELHDQDANAVSQVMPAHLPNETEEIIHNLPSTVSAIDFILSDTATSHYAGANVLVSKPQTSTDKALTWNNGDRSRQPSCKPTCESEQSHYNRSCPPQEPDRHTAVQIGLPTCYQNFQSSQGPQSSSSASSHLGSTTPNTMPASSPKTLSKPSHKFAVELNERKSEHVSPEQDGRRTVSSMALPMRIQADSISLSSKDATVQSRNFKVLDRIRPARLNLYTMPTVPSKNNRTSVSSMSTLAVPFFKTNRPSLQASSIYSRNSQGLTIGRTPMSPNFPRGELGVVDEGDPEEDRHLSRAMSMDFQFKVDGWNLNTSEIQFSTIPSPSPLRRTLSDAGPRSPKLSDIRPLALPIVQTKSSPRPIDFTMKSISLPKICIQPLSDDIFGPKHVESGTVLKRVLDVEMASSSELDLPAAAAAATNFKHSAPG